MWYIVLTLMYTLMYTLLYSIFCTKFGRVSVTPYCNYSSLYILLLHVSCSTIWDLIEYELLSPVAILCCMLTINYYIIYVFHEALLAKLSIVEYNYGYCKKYSWLYELLLTMKYFLWDISNKVECSWVLAVPYCNG